MIQIVGFTLVALFAQVAPSGGEAQALRNQADEMSSRAQDLEFILKQPGNSAADSKLLQQQAMRLRAEADALRERAQKVEKDATASKKPAGRDYSFLLSQLTGSDKRRALVRIANEKVAQAQHMETMARKKSRPPEESDKLWIEAAALRREAKELQAEGLRVEKEARDSRMAATRAQQEAERNKKFGPR